MPPFLPLLSLNRSQSTRIGSGPGSSIPSEFNMGDTSSLPSTGALPVLFYADLGKGVVRRDIQRHDAIAGVETVGTASLTVTSDLVVLAGLGVTYSGSAYTATVAAGTLGSRFYGTRIGVSPQTVALPTPPSVGGQWTYVCINNAGQVVAVPGTVDSVAPTYETWSITATGASAGNFTVQFQYNGFVFTTGNIAFNALGSAVGTAVQAATGGPANIAFSSFVGGTAGITGGGTALPGGPATVTFSGAVEGPVTPLFVDNTGLTNGTAVITRTSQGVGGQTPWPSGNYQVLSAVYLTSGNANANAGAKITYTPPAT